MMMRPILALLVVSGVATAADAQVARNAQPTGGQVIAGSARINQTGTATTITQTSPRAAIGWTGFDVGSGQSVTFNQPSSSALALNRVTSASASQIAGHISANGQIVLMNQSGVVFLPGATVDAQSVVVSAASMSNAMLASTVAGSSGRLVFDLAPNPGAKISNAGTMTVQQAGIAALVAPQVANSGTINARLAQVVLAGANTATLDLYGDGLLAIDVTRQVTSADLNGRTVPALVTNSGTIAADGGTIVLTAAAAAGVVQTLVTAGGTLQANSVGAKTGAVLMRGSGGDIEVGGAVQATGAAAGGQIEIATDGAVAVAATARIDASGSGGVVALGTTRVRPAGVTASRTSVARGATVRAVGGTVTVAGGSVAVDGAVTGGAIALQAGGGGIALSGMLAGSSVDLTTPGSVTQAAGGVIDTALLTGQVGSASLGGTNRVSALGGFGAQGGFALTTTQALTLTGRLDAGSASASLSVGGTLTEQGSGAIVAGTLAGGAASATLGGDNAIGALGRFAAPGGFTLHNTGGLQINGTLDAGTSAVALTTSGGLTQGAGGAIIAGVLTGAASSVALGGANAISALGAFAAPGGFALTNATALTLTGLLDAGGSAVNLTAGGALSERGGAIRAATLAGSAASADLTGANAIATLGNFAAPAGFSLDNTAGLTLAGTLDARHGVAEIITQGSLDQAGGTILAATLAGSASAAVLRGANAIAALGDFTAPGGFALADTQALSITGTLDAGSGAVVLLTPGGITQAGGAIIAGSLTGSAASLTLDGGNSIRSLGSFTATGGFALHDSGDLTIIGRLDAGAATANLAVGGALAERGGTIQAGTLTGRAASATLNGANSIATLGAFTTTASFALTDAAPLTIAGPLTAASLSISAAGSLTLAGDMALTGGPGQTSSLAVSLQTADGGAFLTQTGTTTITGSGGLSFFLLGPGNVSLSNLLAPGLALSMDLGAGRASGNLSVGSLTIAGAGGSAALTGSVASPAGVTLVADGGQPVAGVVASYTFNGCAAGAPACAPIVLPPFVIPPTPAPGPVAAGPAAPSVVASAATPPAPAATLTTAGNVSVLGGVVPLLPGAAGAPATLPTLPALDRATGQDGTVAPVSF